LPQRSKARKKNKEMGQNVSDIIVAKKNDLNVSGIFGYFVSN